MTFDVRRAVESEAMSLNDLASRSKAYWPYEKSYLELCRAATHVTSEDVKEWPFLVGINDKKVCGFAAISVIHGINMLDHLWIEPEFIGKGLGSLLFSRSVDEARKLGWNHFEIVSDPYAEEFYLKMGAVRIGEKESKVKPGLFLPLLSYRFCLHGFARST